MHAALAAALLRGEARSISGRLMQQHGTMTAQTAIIRLLFCDVLSRVSPHQPAAWGIAAAVIAIKAFSRTIYHNPGSCYTSHILQKNEGTIQPANQRWDQISASCFGQISEAASSGGAKGWLGEASAPLANSQAPPKAPLLFSTGRDRVAHTN